MEKQTFIYAEALLPLIIPLLLLVLGYFLGKLRDHSRFIREKRIEIYSELIFHIHYSFQYPVFNKRLELIGKMIEKAHERLGQRKDSKDQADQSEELNDYENKLSEIESKHGEQELELEKRSTMIQQLSRARLVASKSLDENLLKLFNLLVELEDVDDQSRQEEIDQQISEEVMIIEQKMKKEIMGSRVWSDKEIRKHFAYKKNS